MIEAPKNNTKMTDAAASKNNQSPHPHPFLPTKKAPRRVLIFLIISTHTPGGGFLVFFKFFR